MRQSLHSERFPRPLLPCHNNDHYHHCAKRGLSYRYINPGTPRLLWSNFTLICGPVLCTTVSGAVTGDHGSPPSSSEPAQSSEGGRRGGVSSQRQNQTSSPAKALKQRPLWSVTVRGRKLLGVEITFLFVFKIVPDSRILTHRQSTNKTTGFVSAVEGSRQNFRPSWNWLDCGTNQLLFLRSDC